VKDKINELETNSKNKHIRDLYGGITECKKLYQPRSNIVKDDNDNLLADAHNILKTWKKKFCQLLNIRGTDDIRQIEMHIAEPLLPQPS
jgi:hypothetical protein